MTMGFQNEPLGDLVAVGLVEARAARIWMRSAAPGRLVARWWRAEAPGDVGERTLDIACSDPCDNTASVLLPGDGAAPLQPLCRYRFAVTHGDGHEVGSGAFETAPADPTQTRERFAFAFLSCNQPFDDRGAVRPQTHDALVAAKEVFDRHAVKYVLLIGDQVYSDYPETRSLLDERYFRTVAPAGRSRLHDCTVEEVRRLYQARYKHFWGLPGWTELFASYPCYPMLDDHDIVDNWGSRPAHREQRWSSICRGARLACLDYQMARVRPPEDGLPGSFHYAFEYGDTATFVMDLRSERHADPGGQLYAERQREDLERFLRANQDRGALFIVLPVPVLHLPRLLVRMAARLPGGGEDFSDRWSSPSHIRDRDRLMRLLHAHQQACPNQPLTLLSGDIHVGCAHELRWSSGQGILRQLTSSAITNVPTWLMRRGSELLIRMNRYFDTEDGSLRGKLELMRGTSRSDRNPYGLLNLGLVEVETRERGARPSIRFSLYGHKGDQPMRVFRSEAF